MLLKARPLTMTACHPRRVDDRKNPTERLLPYMNNGVWMHRDWKVHVQPSTCARILQGHQSKHLSLLSRNYSKIHLNGQNNWKPITVWTCAICTASTHTRSYIFRNEYGMNIKSYPKKGSLHNKGTTTTTVNKYSMRQKCSMLYYIIMGTECLRWHWLYDKW